MQAVTREVLGQIGRDLVRTGESLHAIRMDGGMLRLIPCASWHWEGSHDPATWMTRATAYGPSTSTTWHLPASSVVFVRWGGDPGSPYLGKGPLRYAATTAKLAAQAERSLADEAGGPIAQLLTLADGAGGSGAADSEAADPLAKIKADIAGARGRAAFVESTGDAWGEGRDAAPRRDWQASRLGPAPPAGLVEARKAAFEATLAACGTTIALFDDSDGTAQREAVRRWHMGTVTPLARVVESELSTKLGAPIRLRFDNYPLDLAGRAQAFQKLVAGGVAVNEALATSGLLADDDA